MTHRVSPRLSGFSRNGLAVGAALSLCLVCGSASGQFGVLASDPAPKHHHHDHEGLPPIDVRLNADGTPNAAALAALSAWAETPAAIRRGVARQRVLSQVQGLRADDHPLFGTPHFVRSTEAFMTAPAKGLPRDIAAAYLLANGDYFELGNQDLAEARVVRDYDTHGIMHHLTFQQTIDGIDVFNSILRTNVTGRGEMINVSSAFVPRPAGGWRVPAFALSAEQAFRIAAASVDAPIVGELEECTGIGAEEKIVWTVGDELDHWTPITTRKVMFPLTRDDVRPAYLSVIPTKGTGHTYDVIVDAVDGRVLYRGNWLVNETTEPASYRVYTGDSPAPWSPGPSTPSSTQAPFVLREMVTVLPAQISTFSPNGWIPDGGTTTTGNNVDAYLDRDGTANSPDADGRPISATRVFDYPINVDANNMPTDAPTAYSMASVTHGFYHANLFHDKLYAMGFNEPAGNFQTDNFGLGGVGGDAVRMEMQDGSGTNNANFSISSDGGIGRCQMYLFTAPTPDRDGGFDQDILYHELTHGVSIRCHENSFGTFVQPRCMGEGWGDFFGICLNAQPTDDFNGTFTTGGHTTYLFQSASYNTNYYFGIRRYPYSTDMTKSPLTYDDIETLTVDPSIPESPVIGGTPSQVHNAGEVWCQTLLEARAAIGLDEGFGANQTIMQLVVDGMKLAPSAPSYLQERDAIMQSDMTRYASQHLGRLWEAFAKRGMGYSAVSPTNAVTGIVEAFDTAQSVTWTLPDGTPDSILPGVPTQLRVQVAPQLLTLTPNSGQIFISVDGGPFVGSPMAVNSPSEYLATIPGQACLDSIQYYFQVGTSVGNKTNPSSAPATSYSAFSSIVQAAGDWDMESAAGWTVGPSTATSGVWNRMDPGQTFAQPGDDTTTGAGVNCWVTDGNPGTAVGAFDVDGGFTYLNSPTFDLTDSNGVVIEYMRWASNAASATPPATYGDPWLVEISNNNGGTWTPFEAIAVGSPHQQGWFLVSRTFASLGITGTNQMKLRFRAEDSGTASISEAAIDDLRIYRHTCPVGPTCDSVDYNGDGLFPDTQDINDFLTVFGGGTCPTGTCGDIDFNNDGLFPDTLDIDSLLSVFAGGACL